MDTYMIAKRVGGKGNTPATSEFCPEFGTFKTVQEAADFIKYERFDFEMQYFFITLSSEMERISAFKVGA